MPHENYDQLVDSLVQQGLGLYRQGLRNKTKGSEMIAHRESLRDKDHKKLTADQIAEALADIDAKYVLEQENDGNIVIKERLALVTQDKGYWISDPERIMNKMRTFNLPISEIEKMSVSDVIRFENLTADAEAVFDEHPQMIDLVNEPEDYASLKAQFRSQITPLFVKEIKKHLYRPYLKKYDDELQQLNKKLHAQGETGITKAVAKIMQEIIAKPDDADIPLINQYTQALKTLNKALTDTNNEAAELCQSYAATLSDAEKESKLAYMFMFLSGLFLVTASIGIALASSGVLSPFSILGVKIGIGLITASFSVAFLSASAMMLNERMKIDEQRKMITGYKQDFFNALQGNQAERPPENPDSARPKID